MNEIEERNRNSIRAFQLEYTSVVFNNTLLIHERVHETTQITLYLSLAPVIIVVAAEHSIFSKSMQTLNRRWLYCARRIQIKSFIKLLSFTNNCFRNFILVFLCALHSFRAGERIYLPSTLSCRECYLGILILLRRNHFSLLRDISTTIFSRRFFLSRFAHLMFTNIPQCKYNTEPEL